MTLIVILIVVIVFAIVAGGGWYYEAHRSPVANSSATLSVSSTTSSNGTSSQVTDADINAVKVILAAVDQNNSVANFLRYVTTSTAGTYNVESGASVLRFTVDNVFPSGADIVASLSFEPNPAGLDSGYWIFIKEGSDWKYDGNATDAYNELHNGMHVGPSGPGSATP